MSAGATPFYHTGSDAGNIAVAGLVGGAASKLGGGSFSDGAATAAFGYLFNQMATRNPGIGHNGGPPLQPEIAQGPPTEDWNIFRMLGRGVLGLPLSLGGSDRALMAVGDYTLSRGVEAQARELSKDGSEWQRPYQNSPTMIDWVASSGTRVPDPQGVPGLYMYTAAGTFRGSGGTYELLMNPTNKTIYHFLFRSTK